MKKQGLIIIVILFLILASVYFGFIRKSNAELTEFDLQITDTSQITSFVVSTENVEVKLEKKANGWVVNDSYHANNQLIKRALRIFKNLNISIFAQKDSINNYIHQLKTNGTKLQFLKNERIIANYWIGNYNITKNATLIMNDREQPIYVTSPGLSANISKFVIADNIFWRDKRIFDFEAKQITKISLNDYRNQSASFKIIVENDNYQLTDNSGKEIKFNEENISRYLSYFKGVRFESLEEKFSTVKLDSVIRQKPLFEINLEVKDYGKLSLKLLPKSDSIKNQEIDLNNVYGLLNNTPPIIIISYFSIDPLLKEIAYFKPETN